MSKATAMVAEAEILRYEREVNEALRRLSMRTGFVPATSDVPMYTVTGADVDGTFDEWQARKEAIRRFFEYLLADGPEPVQVLRRLYAIGKHMGIEPFCLLNVREMGMMLGDSHGAQHWRMKRIVAGLQRNGARSIKAPGQKGTAASAAASKAQLGNHNRVSGHGAAERKSKRKTIKQTHEKNGHSH